MPRRITLPHWREVLDVAIGKIRYHFVPRSEFREWIAFASDLWGVASMIAAVLALVAVTFMPSQITSKELATVIYAFGGMAVLAVIVFAIFVLQWRSERNKLVGQIRTLKKAHSIVALRVLLQDSGRSWRLDQLQEECDKRDAPFGGPEDLMELIDEDLVSLDQEKIRLTNRSKRYADFALYQLNNPDVNRLPET